MVKIEIDTKQLRQAIKQMSLKERAQLLKELQKELSTKKIDEILANIDNRRRKSGLSLKEIDQEIEKARREFYNRRR